MRPRHKRAPIKRDFESKVVEIKRVTRVVKGGKRMRFRALVVIGDKKGRVGFGVKKGTDVAEAVNKATNQAKKTMISVPIVNNTIPHQVLEKYKAAQVLMKPASEGTGVIAGGAVRAVIDLAGIHNISSKMIGSPNKLSNVRAAYEALKKLKKPKEKKEEKLTNQSEKKE